MAVFKKIISQKKIELYFKNWSPISLQILNFFKNILDPEIRKTLFLLKVISPEGIFIEKFKHSPNLIFRFWIIPTVKKCSMSSLIGLFIENIAFQKPLQKNLNNFLPKNWNWKFSFEIPEFSHFKSESYSKQLNDKERISAAFENKGVRGTLDKCYKR